MKKLMTVIAILISLIGIAHIVVTPLTFKTFSADSLWFGSAGLVFVFLAFVHILIIREQRTLFFIIGYIANGLSAMFFILFLSIIISPNFILLLALVVVQTILFALLQSKS